MTQQTDGISREADLDGVTTTSPSPSEPAPPDEFSQALQFVFLTISLYFLYMLCTSVALVVLRDSGFYAWYYGPAFVAGAFDPLHPQQAAQTRLQLWALAAAFPCWLTTTGLLVWFLPSTYRRDIGVSLGRFPRRDGGPNVTAAPWSLLVNCLIAIAAWLVLAPLALGVNFLLVWLYSRNGEVAQEEHPFTVAAQGGSMRPLEWGLLALSVMVSAPLWEELLFRGLLPALCRKLRGTGGYAPMMLALAAALFLRRQPIAEALAAGSGVSLLYAATPALFVVALLPIYALVCWLSRSKNGPVVFGVAVLFGAVHSFVWPTPVALFMLGLGLGWLAVWTRSLIAPIIVHALFNAISFVMLYFGLVTM